MHFIFIRNIFDHWDHHQQFNNKNFHCPYKELRYLKYVNNNKGIAKVKTKGHNEYKRQLYNIDN